jgi:hypothetical protein
MPDQNATANSEAGGNTTMASVEVAESNLHDAKQMITVLMDLTEKKPDTDRMEQIYLLGGVIKADLKRVCEAMSAIRSSMHVVA